MTLFALFAIDAATTAPWFGAGPILLAALAAWIPFGSMLVWLSHRWHGAPLFTLFLLAAVVFGLWNDNHAVRALAGTVVASARRDDCNAVTGTSTAPAARSAPRYPVCGHAKRWRPLRGCERHPVRTRAIAAGEYEWGLNVMVGIRKTWSEDDNVTLAAGGSTTR